MAKIKHYPGLERVALILALDNGMVNRGAPADQWLAALDPVLERWPDSDLRAASDFCAGLSEAEAQELAAGDSAAAAAVADRFAGNARLDDLLDDIFNAG